MNKKTEKSSQMKAVNAAALEKNGQYEDAASWWMMAANAATDRSSRHWYESRAELCGRYALVPLLVPGNLRAGK